jgi:FkbH-like protein
MNYIPTFNELRKASFSEKRVPLLKIALLGDSPTQLLKQAIAGYATLNKLNIDIWEADYNQISLQINNPDSSLYNFNPDYVLLFFSSEKLLQRFYQSHSRGAFSEMVNEEIQQLYHLIISRTPAHVILYNFYEIDDAVLGNYASKSNEAFITQLRKLNLFITDFAASQQRLSIADVASDYHRVGALQSFAPNIYIQSGFVWSLDFLPFAAKRIIDILRTQQGIIKKCLILDLDDTLWGGTVGDDGWQNLQLGDLGIGKAFTEFQQWIKELKQRGIILCVCSKNDEATAREVFQKHPDMILREDDFAVFVANWENKADNIRAIQGRLNIGFDSMVFIDNSAFERNLVRAELPEIEVPELPEDPAEYLMYLRQLNLFDTSGITEEDIIRTNQYREEVLRLESIKHFTNENDYLKSLQMKAREEAFNAFNTPRVAQLTQRSNQFNLRTVRYTEADISKLAQSKNHITKAFYLCDKFGDYGLISVVVLEKNSNELFIDTWLMSCRVLKRGVEHFVMNSISESAIKEGITVIRAQYLPTDKNGLVMNLLLDMGFQKMNEDYILDITSYKPFHTNIQSL